MGGKECKDQERFENMKKKIHAIAKKVFWHGIATLSGPVAVDEERIAAAARNSVDEKGDQKGECDSPGHVVRRSSDKWPVALLRKVFG